MSGADLRVVVTDIDGCLTPGEGGAWDFDVLRFVAALNRRARAGDAPFAVTLCTGRQQPYVEAMMQAIDGHLPAIYENGAGLYFPHPYRFVAHPAITPTALGQLAEIRRVLQTEMVERGLAQLQPGKELSLTLYPAREPLSLAELAERARAVLGGTLNGFVLYASVSSVEILAAGINKGAGVEWLARELDLSLSSFGGIGDAPADLTFLSKLRSSAAPANATADVRASVQYTSPYSDARGVRDILEKWLES
ncbi:MAG: HAD family phosphatase [Anaerolineae bacterium]|nr:HAD family phosphatase [Anaerolineae bacterium]